MSIEKQLVTAEEAGPRFDLWCVGKISGVSRAVIQRGIRDGTILLNGEVVKPRKAVAEGDEVKIGELGTKDIVSEEPQDIKIPIIFEDEDVVVIDKPAGVVVHAGVGGERTTVATWFASKYPDSYEVGEALNEGVERAGVVHRLDKDTSGVLVLAKTHKGYEHLKKQFMKRNVKKEYVALVFGVPTSKDGRIVQALARSKSNPMRRAVAPDGKKAVTEWRKIRSFKEKYAYLRLWPLTGRTHQLRVHLHWLGHPIVGDSLYVFKRQKSPLGVKRHLLHAENLTLKLPSGKRKTFNSPLPEDFEKVLEELK